MNVVHREPCDEPPKAIQCKVMKKSTWQNPCDSSRNFKSITLDLVPGRYFGVGDENSKQYEYGTISLSCCEDVPAFFDDFRVGQLVEMIIRPVEKNE
jgi:hypothetical protein